MCPLPAPPRKRRNRQINRPGQISLYCLPYAGGNAFSYRSLEACRPPGLTVSGIELPGRGRRVGEALCFSLEELADDIFAQLQKSIVRERYALFGHSMGAALAYLCLLRIRRAGLPLPEAVFLSGKSAPTVSRAKGRYLLPREEFIKMLGDLGGCPPEILQDEELINYFEPILRADFQAIETWQHRAEEPLPVPMVVLLGRDDEVSRNDAAAWALETSEEFQLHEFDGDHFFIQQHWERIASLIGTTLGLPVSA